MTPREMGYRMPAEWEPHAATWLSWPHDPITFPGRVPAVEQTYQRIIQALAPNERVNLLVKDDETHARVQRWLAKERVKNVVLWDIPPADVWFRDYGPIFVKNDSPAPGQSPLAMTKWDFNAWGEKYDALLPDNQIPYKLHPHLGLPMFETGIVMEGGSLEVNGRGTLITTTQCLLNENRNPHLSQAQIESYLRDYLGVTNFVWLGDGIEGDDTDGHVDDITRFVDARTIVTVVEPDTDDVNHAPLAANLETLRNARDPDGQPFTVVELPMPSGVEDDEGRLPASYANFYTANNVVLMPVFDAPEDKRALSILQKCFPARNVVPIPCRDLVHGMGTLHCISQQQPLG